MAQDGKPLAPGDVAWSIDLGLWILHGFFDADLAEEVGARMEYSPNT